MPTGKAELMRALVTGATGFLGGAVIQQLLGDGGEVLGVCRRPAPDLEDRGGTTCDLRTQGSCAQDEDYYWTQGAMCESVCCDRGELGTSPLTRASCTREGALGGMIVPDAECE